MEFLHRLAGRFIVFDGPDGSGKSTHFRRLTYLCASRGVRVCGVREPGGTAIGEQIRAVLLDPANASMGVRCEALLYMASRAQLVDAVIRPALARGEFVLADRFVSSTLAYQGAAGGLPAEQIEALARVALGGIEPDLVVVFDVDASTAARRLAPLLKEDRMEAKGVEFQRRVRAGFLEQAERWPERYAVIDASGDEEAVWSRLEATLGARVARG